MYVCVLHVYPVPKEAREGIVSLHVGAGNWTHLPRSDTLSSNTHVCSDFDIPPTT